MTAQATGIRFQATPYTLQGQTLLRLPPAASEQLSSRGQVAVTGTINTHTFQTVLEPDGDWGHWLRLDEGLLKKANIQVGEAALVAVTQTKDWPEPDVPADFMTAVADAPTVVRALWKAITPMARWEWIRWVNATGVTETRQRRIVVSISKLNDGKRRPCCFNLAACTDPQLSKNGKLIK